ncbi:hypothetical protein M422DRAFT_261042 [Sphaerobolus stellatus SS14]|uniref:NACHT domain-containing protein n=1 Tax=Sphaerobolus stellatus (strain SS14) TaxID=990650 RepID=A0A0C9V436_SPHS4|nr:hypothetical protein M422DRAFT_261042 [Sphaerobolus stellatus SS14]
MDPLSATANIVAVLQLVSGVSSLTYNFVTAGRQAQAASSHTRTELFRLETVLLQLKSLFHEDKTKDVPHTLLRDIATWLEECRSLLEDLTICLRRSDTRIGRISDRLLWPLKEKQVHKLMELTGRTKTWVLLGLTVQQSQSVISMRNEQLKEYDSHLRTTIFRWLAPLDVETDYNFARSLSHISSGQWFLSSKLFLRFRDETRTHLWLHGIPGCGKTVLSGSIVAALKEQLPSDSTVGLGYFFFSFRDIHKQTVNHMLSTIVAHLLRRLTVIPTSILDVYYANPIKPSNSALLKIISCLSEIFQRTYIVLDALDEILTEEREELFNVLRQISRCNVNILLASRQESYIVEGLRTVPITAISMNTSIVNVDIELFVEDVLENDLKFTRWSKQTREMMKETIVTKACGMFRWVDCQLESLRGCRNANAVKRALLTLPDSLDETYHRVLAAIPQEDIELTAKLLMWTAFSQRPLTVDEVAEAIIIEIDSHQIDEDERFADPMDILSLCGSLVTILTPEDSPDHRNYVGLSHYSVQEYLTSNRILDTHLWPICKAMQEADIRMAKTCITYMTFDVFKVYLLHNQTSGRVEDLYPLFNYVQTFWPQHILFIKDEEERRQLELEFAYTLYDFPNLFYNWAGYKKITANSLVFFARAGVESAVEMGLTRGEDVNYFRDDGIPARPTALAAAAYGGHTSIVALLISNGAVDSFEPRYAFYAGPRRVSPALAAAIRQRHFDIVRLLIETGTSDINCGGHVYRRTSLQLSMVPGTYDSVIFEYLLQKGVSANEVIPSLGSECPTALATATSHGNVSAVHLLLQHGADCNVRLVRNAETVGAVAAVAACSWPEQDTLIRLLISYGADINALNCILPSDDGRAFQYCTALDMISSPHDLKIFSRMTVVSTRSLTVRRQNAARLLQSYGAEVRPREPVVIDNRF